MELSLNELSLNERCSTVQEARNRVEVFAKVIRESASLGIAQIVRTPRYFRQLSLADGYVIEQWARDSNHVSIDLIRFVLTVCTKAPHLDEVLKSYQKGVDEECTFEGAHASGIAVAHYSHGATISFIGHSKFACEKIGFDFCFIEDNDVTVQKTEVLNFSTVAHVYALKSEILRRIADEQSVLDGRDMWDRRATLYPFLEFCQETSEYLNSLQANDPLLKHINRHFRCLNEACRKWTSGSFVPAGVDWSSESSRTMNEPRLAKMREATMPDGRTEVFVDHTKIHGHNIRIHFFSQSSPGKFVAIGYVGPHLPTSNYKT